jgi:hypothetical protein
MINLGPRILFHDDTDSSAQTKMIDFFQSRERREQTESGRKPIPPHSQ